MATENLQSVAIVSDLHLFCRRSEAHHHVDSIRIAASESDVFVLNGDIFDFRWSTLDSPEQTVASAIAWLGDLVGNAPACRFYYVLGNHDHYRPLIEALDAFAADRPNFEWSPYYLRLGPALFLHGDVAIRKMTAADLEQYREGWLDDPIRGPVFNAVFDLAFRFGIHKSVGRLAFPQDPVLERLHHYVEDIGHGAASGVETVYFGHTHIAMIQQEYNGVTYHNGGATMPGLDFHVLKAELAI